MCTLTVQGRVIAIDKEGYLENLADWNKDVAEAIAAEQGIHLSADHWEIVRLTQRFYQDFEHSPAMRILVKFIKQNLGESKGNSIYLMQLFPESPAKLIAKIAGLPRPTNCL